MERGGCFMQLIITQVVQIADRLNAHQCHREKPILLQHLLLSSASLYVLSQTLPLSPSRPLHSPATIPWPPHQITMQSRTARHPELALGTKNKLLTAAKRYLDDLASCRCTRLSTCMKVYQWIWRTFWDVYAILLHSGIWDWVGNRRTFRLGERLVLMRLHFVDLWGRGCKYLNTWKFTFLDS